MVMIEGFTSKVIPGNLDKLRDKNGNVNIMKMFKYSLSLSQGNLFWEWQVAQIRKYIYHITVKYNYLPALPYLY